jgi:hypothetical protein
MIENFNITKAKYSNNFFGEADSIFATINGVEMHVPMREGNRHYKAIQAWVAEGNTIEEAD